MATEFDNAKLKALMRLKPTVEDTAAFFECSPRTVQRYIKDEFNLEFKEFREMYMVHTRLNIIRKAIEKAEKGDNVMLIFCLKNLCGWRDRNEPPPQEAPPVQPIVTLSEDQLKMLVKAARDKSK